MLSFCNVAIKFPAFSIDIIRKCYCNEHSMNFLIHQRSKKPKLSSLANKSKSYVAILENPPLLSDQNAENFTIPNPIGIPKNPSKPRYSSHMETKVSHCHLLRTLIFYNDIFKANTLVHSYFRCGHKGYALKVFNEIPKPNLVSWNLMVSGCNKISDFQESWRFFCKMHGLDLAMDQYSYGGVLSACGAAECVLWGEQVYGFVMKNGFFSNGYVRTGMIDLFSGSQRFMDALRVFFDISCENVVVWNTMISAGVKNKENWVALDIFCRMLHSFLMPNAFTLSSVLTACAAVEQLEFGKGVQGMVIKSGVGDDVFVGTAVVDLYSKCGYMHDAVKQFWLIPERNVVSWTALISGFAQRGDFVSAAEFFKIIIVMEEEVSTYTVTSILTACASPAAVKEAIQLHAWIVKTGFFLDSVVKASLINMYAKIGAVDASETVFAETEDKNHIGTWATMISAFAQANCSEKAVHIFQSMLQEDLKPDEYCTSSVLGITDSLNLGRQIHGYTAKTGLLFDISVGSSLFIMYSKCGSLEESYNVFKLLEGKDNVSWACMISGFVKNGSAANGIQCFREMLLEDIVPDEMVLNAVLTACSSLRSLQRGKELHGFGIRSHVGKQVNASSALLNMYSKCGDLVSARRVFEMMPEKDEVTFSSMISGYAQSGCIEEVIHLFQSMLMDDMHLDAFTFSSLLGGVANSNGSDIGSQIHAHVVKLGLESDVTVGSSLVMMYSKAGSVDDCHKVFQQILRPDVIGWTAVIAGYAQNGKGPEALQVYECMKKAGVRPDAVTFVGVLSACSHCGLVEEGYLHLRSMKDDYGIEPGCRHYACIVDLLGRAGRLKEAERFINDMPIQPNALVWGTLLSACKVHGDFDIGNLAAQNVMQLEPCEAGTYVSLANIYADVGQWEGVLKLRSDMEGTGVVKEPGWSSV